jgi:hypothetical protein
MSLWNATLKTAICKLSLEFGSDAGPGWSEQFWLPYADQNSTQLLMQTIAMQRRWCLTQDCSLIYAKCSVVGKPADSLMADASFVGAGLYPGSIQTPGSPPVINAGSLKVNSLRDAVLFRTTNPDGAWANHYMHGIPDEQVVEQVLVNAIVTSTVAPPNPLTYAPSIPWQQIVGDYWYQVLALTIMVKQSGSPPVGSLFTQKPTKVQSRGWADHKVGRPFDLPRGRVIRR